MAVPAAAQKVVEASPAALRAGMSFMKIYERWKAPVAALIQVLLFNAGMPFIEVCKQMVVPVATKKAAEASPVVVDNGPPITRICRRGAVFVATQEEDETPPGRNNKMMAPLFSHPMGPWRSWWEQ